LPRSAEAMRLRRMYLEVVCDSDRRIAYVVIAISAEIGLPEVGSLIDEAAVFDANIEAWTDFVSDTATVKSADVGVPRQMLKRRLLVVNRAAYETTYSCFKEGIEVFIIKAADVRAGNFLKAIVNQHIVGGIGEMLDLLRILIIQLKAAPRGEEIAVTDERAKADRSM
jgi:hypothetical protein